MFQRISFVITIGLVTLLVTINNKVSAEPGRSTSWEVVDQSLGQLLNSGWRIVAHSNSKFGAERRVTLGTTWVEELNYSYVLQKGDKYINCLVTDPFPSKAYSYCRRIN